MQISRIKNYLIIILLVAAVYQTGKLWLGDMAGHNFFYSVISVFGQNKPSIQREEKVLLPGRFAVGKGNRKFAMCYPDNGKNETIMEASTDLMVEILSQGAYDEKVVPADWKKIQGSKCVLFLYDFLAPIESYMGNFSKSSGGNEMKEFDSIAILPPKSSSDSASLYFINTKNDQSIQLTLDKNKYGSTLSAVIDTVDTDLNYASTAQSGFKIFAGNTFVPQFSEDSYTYPLITADMPFEKGGVVNRSLLENSVDSFFKNFAADWASKDDSGTYLFSDESVAVKYYPQGILEYYNYDSYNEEYTPSLLEGYQVCQNFLDSDKSLSTDVYLSYIHMGDKEIVYYFDYQVNNFPVVFSDPLRRKLATNHAIEIVVKDKSVRKYRRYACNFKSQPSQTGVVNVDFLLALNQSIMEYRNEENTDVVTEVGDVYLGYEASATGNPNLKWYTELYERVFVQNTNNP